MLRRKRTEIKYRYKRDQSRDQPRALARENKGKEEQQTKRRKERKIRHKKGKTRQEKKVEGKLPKKRGKCVTSSALLQAVCSGFKHLLLIRAIVIGLCRDGAAAATTIRRNDGTVISPGDQASSSNSSLTVGASRCEIRRVVTWGRINGRRASRADLGGIAAGAR